MRTPGHGAALHLIIIVRSSSGLWSPCKEKFCPVYVELVREIWRFLTLKINLAKMLEKTKYAVAWIHHLHPTRSRRDSRKAVKSAATGKRKAKVEAIPKPAAQKPRRPKGNVTKNYNITINICNIGTSFKYR